ncbi:MAG: DNA-3-methyladenine glycosylase I [Acidobacteriota bacterium]|nr:DNA-3-methyladenine glycosylase I [Acidobacteriota bacterium]MDH3785544.1 DNA-3-methyladenine glycosylase I [Acidobacteriota bacterium]
MARKTRKRCWWCGDDPLYVSYHDKEWGKPIRRDRKLFEMLILEGAQAGLSWITVLRKRDRYREQFRQFDPAVVAAFGKADVQRMMADPGVIRNRAKLESAIDNARVFLKIRDEFGTFSKYLWGFVDGQPIIHRRRRPKDVPAKTPLAESLSKDLKTRGMRFVGPTILYAYMQSVGMVNDHLVDCFRYPELGGR